MAKLSHDIIDTPATMAVKSHLLAILNGITAGFTNT